MLGLIVKHSTFNVCVARDGTLLELDFDNAWYIDPYVVTVGGYVLDNKLIAF